MADWPEGYGRRVLAEVDSTNVEAARMAADLAGPTWILGLKQPQAMGGGGGSGPILKAISQGLW